jgi:hypothetical protein
MWWVGWSQAYYIAGRRKRIRRKTRTSIAKIVNEIEIDARKELREMPLRC